MIQIYVYGDKHQGFLDLAPNANFTLQALAEVFDDELTLGEYSLPLDAPFTDNNKKILGNVEVLSSVPGNETLYWRCNISSDGVPVRSNAKLSLVGISGSFNYATGTYSFTVAGNKGLFGSLIVNKTLQDLTLAPIWMQLQPARVFAYYVMMQFPGYNQYPFMKFSPVVIENFFDTSRADYNNEFLVGDVVNTIVVFSNGSGGFDWVFGVPVSAGGPGTFAGPGTLDYLNFRTVPFFSYKWILQKIFEEFGYTLTGDVLNDPAWDKAFMFNTFGVEQYDLTAMTDVSSYIYPNKHLPKKLIGTFLRDLQFFFCCKFSFLDGNIVRMDYRKSDLQSKKIMDATGVTARLFNSNVLDYREKGFKFTFNFDSADSYNGEKVQSIDGRQVVATVKLYADLFTLVIKRPFTVNDLAFVIAENTYYVYNGSTDNNTPSWIEYSERLFPFLVGSGGYDYQTGISPLVTWPVLVEGSQATYTPPTDMVAASMPGCYYNAHNQLVRNDFDTRIFYIDMILPSGSFGATIGIPLPSSFVHNRDKLNLQRAAVSLAWDGDEGLYQTLWKEWITFLMNTRAVTAPMDFNEKSYRDFCNATKIRIAGTLYLVYNSSVEFPLEKGSASVELYRL